MTKNLDGMLEEDADFAEVLTVLAREIQSGEIRPVGLDEAESKAACNPCSSLILEEAGYSVFCNKLQFSY